MEELRDRDAARDWLCAGLCLGRIGRPSPESIATGAEWVLAAVVERPDLPPPGVVADLGHILSGAELDFGGPTPEDPRLKQALRSYEDQVLGRIAGDLRLDSLVDAVARLPRDLRPAAVGLFTAGLMERIGFQHGVLISPGTARSLVDEPPDEALDRGLAALRDNPDTIASLALSYEQLVDAVRGTGTLIADAEVFALENLQVLRGLAQRVAIRQVLDAAEALEKGLPKKIKRRSRSAGHTPTTIEDESAYPVGGFAAISNSGSFENLVSSELIYMEEDRAEIDLFVVRWAESELLYYTRDESVYVRHRRAFTFALLPDLVEARFKDPGVGYQRLVLVLALLLTAVRRLEDWLGRTELEFRIAFVTGGRAHPLENEEELARLALKEWRDKGLVDVVHLESRDAVMELARKDRQIAQTDVVWIGLSPETPEANPRIQQVALSLADGWPDVLWDRGPASERPADRWTAWLRAASELIQGIA